MPKTATAKDVAKLAGVSQATVSLVLNDHTGRFSDDTRSRVQDAAAELGFLPSRTARALRTGRSDSVVLLSPNMPSGANGAAAVGRITDAVAALGFDLVVRRLRDDEPLSVLWEAPAPAAIIGTQIPALEDLQAMRAAGVLPLFVDWDEVNTRIGALQIKHLADRGHRRIAFVGPADDRSRSFARARIEGATLECRNRGLDELVQAEIEIDPVSAEQIVVRLWTAGVTAVVAYNDDDAFAVLFGARSRGLRVPEDLAVIGVDDLPLGRVALPPLSTVQTRQHGIIESIGALRSGAAADPIGVDLTVIARQSS